MRFILWFFLFHKLFPIIQTLFHKVFMLEQPNNIKLSKPNNKQLSVQKWQDCNLGTSCLGLVGWFEGGWDQVDTQKQVEQ